MSSGCGGRSEQLPALSLFWLVLLALGGQGGCVTRSPCPLGMHSRLAVLSRAWTLAIRPIACAVATVLPTHVAGKAPDNLGTVRLPPRMYEPNRFYARVNVCVHV